MAKIANSLETILTIDNIDTESDACSVVWSTSHVAGGGAGAGAGGGARRARRSAPRRRRLRLAALALGCLLTMHCRVAASALTGGFFVFILLLVPSVALLANPLRHFEVYLGQWSINGPGRAFRILPMFDGIGLAMCLNALVRAVCCGAMAAVAGLYVFHGFADKRLPSRHCRTFNFTEYEPDTEDGDNTLRTQKNLQPESLPKAELFLDNGVDVAAWVTVETSLQAWNNATHHRETKVSLRNKGAMQMKVCREVFSQEYPQIYRTPPYNFFYVEVMKLQPDYSFTVLNIDLMWSLLVVWSAIWIVMIVERISNGRLIWNNMYSWIIFVPWLWSGLLMTTSVLAYAAKNKAASNIFKLNSKEVVTGISDALEVAIYIHVASIGSELIHGKGLNYYASGHLDPLLNNENVWHSSLLLVLTALNSGGAAVCALVDVTHPTLQSFDNIIESTMWVIPLYSKCTSVGNFSHLQTILIFSGLMFSYMTTAFVFLKTALHIIFEYKVKLIFHEQFLVAALILSCLLLSLMFSTSGGLPLLESVECIMVGVAAPLVCLLELVGLLYVYRSRDFVSDMNVANEETACSTRLNTQWHIIPMITTSMLIMKGFVVARAKVPEPYMYCAVVPLLAVILVVPVRAGVNAYKFLRPPRRRRRPTVTTAE